jgi:hypothetical protein
MAGMMGNLMAVNLDRRLVEKLAEMKDVWLVVTPAELSEIRSVESLAVALVALTVAVKVAQLVLMKAGMSVALKG